MKPLSLTNQLAESIRQDILDGVYPPDSQIRQEALASKYGVSRIPVREALLQLEAEGLVENVPRCGARVTPLSQAEIDDVFALRLLLELRLYRKSAPRLSAEAIKMAFAINDRYRAAIEAQQFDRLGKLNAELHTALYACANLPRTHHIVAGLLQTSERYTRIQLNSDAALQQSLDEHHALLTFTQAGDFVRAEALLQEHLSSVWRGLYRVLHLPDLSVTKETL